MGWSLVVIGVLGLLGGGSGWFCAGCQWLSVVTGGYGVGCFWGVFGWLWVVMGVSRLSLRHSLNDQGQEKTDHSAQ